MDAAGRDSKIVIETYKKAIRSQGLGLTSYVTGLLALQDKMDAKQYADTIKSMTLSDITILSQAMLKADIMMQGKRPDGAVASTKRTFASGLGTRSAWALGASMT